MPTIAAPLSSVLAQETSRAEIELKPAQWWRDNGVTLLYGRGAAAVDLTTRCVRLTNGGSLPFAKLVLATGSRPIRLNVPGADLPGVMTFRDLGDVATIESAAAQRIRAVVIGGGLLGLEAAYGLAKAGSQVTVVHLMDRLMERQLDGHAAEMLKRSVEARGITVHLNAETAEILGQHSVRAVALRDGREIEADLVVVAAGIRANADLGARGLGLETGRGIIVVRDLRATDQPNRYLRHRRMRRTSRNSATGWSSRPTNRRACWPRASQAKPPIIAAACLRPI